MRADPSEIRITGLSMVTKAQPHPSGVQFLAYFDAEVRGFALRGCVLVKTAKNGLVALPPKVEAPDASRRSIAIIDNSLRHQLMMAARDVYRMMGGTEAEWTPRAGGEDGQQDGVALRAMLREPDGAPAA